MTARTTFLLTTIVAVSFLTIAATSSVVFAQQGTLAACSLRGNSGREPCCLHQDAFQGFFFGLPTFASKGSCR
jgi:hypothetical protein